VARNVLHVSEGKLIMFVHITQNRNIGGVFRNNKKGYNSTKYRVLLKTQTNFSLEFISLDFPFVDLHTTSIISFLWCILGSSVLNLNEEQPISVN
jgi:hypothetical protein